MDMSEGIQRPRPSEFENDDYSCKMIEIEADGRLVHVTLKHNGIYVDNGYDFSPSIPNPDRYNVDLVDGFSITEDGNIALLYRHESLR